MSLFACRQCCCIENTALCNYWWDAANKKPVLCSECDPETKQWHGAFDKKPAAGMLVDAEGTLWSSSEQAASANRKIIGKVNS